MNKEDIQSYKDFVEYLDNFIGPQHTYKGYNPVKVETFIKEWSGGGHGDTHDYNGNDHTPCAYTPEVEPEAWNLDTVLEDLAPNLTFIQYRILMGLTTTDTKEERGYYGDLSITMYRKLEYKDLYYFLVERRLL